MSFGIKIFKLNKDTYILLSAVLIMHIASYLVIPVLPIIFNKRGITPSQIGLIIGAGALAFQIGTIISGITSDRIGKKITMFIGSFIQSIAFIGYAFSTNFYLLLVFSVTNGIGGGIYAPTLKAAIASLTSKSSGSQTTAFSLRGIAANIGTSIGGLIVLFLSINKPTIIFIVAAITYGILAILTIILLPKKCGGEDCPLVPINSYKLIFKNKPFVIFGILVILINSIYSLLEFLLPLRGNAILKNENTVGPIFTITSISVIIFQGLISKFIIKKYNPLISLFIAMIFFSFGLFLIGKSYNFMFLTVSAVIFTIGQMFMLPTTDSVVSKLADAKLIGAYFSVANLLQGLGNASGVFIAGKLINTYGIDKNITPWIILMISSLIIGIIILISKYLPAFKNSINQIKEI